MSPPDSEHIKDGRAVERAPRSDATYQCNSSGSFAMFAAMRRASPLAAAIAPCGRSSMGGRSIAGDAVMLSSRQAAASGNGLQRALYR